MRDSRFGQFADPGFGASLSASTPSQGVLPSPEQGTSASDPSQGESASGLSAQPGGSNPGSIYLAEGGAIPDGQDSGDAAPAASDPFSLIQQALNYGRQKMGLPQQFYGSKPKPSNDAAATNQAAQDEGATGNLQDDDLRAFQNNQIMNNAQPGEHGEWGQGNDIEGKEKTAYLAEGGAIDDDTGVIPDGSEQGQSEDQGQSATPSGSAPPNPQSAMSYLKGQGAVGPEIAQALEQQVDPQGTMDPNERKMLAVSKAGSPDKAFGLLQHYRQKFNAYNAFAKAAAQGGGGRPPDLHASAHAATQAYQHLPDGNNVSFQPVPNGMRVAVRKVIPSQPAPSGGEDNSQTQGQPPTKMFAEGGAVEDDDTGNDPMIPEQQEAPEGQDTMPKQSAGPAAPAQDSGPGKGGVLGGKAPHEAVKDFVLSIPQYLGWLSKDGQADSVFDKGLDSTLEQASQSPMSPMAGGPSPQQLPQPQAGGEGGVTSQRPMDPRNQNPMAAPSKGHETPKDPAQAGAQIGGKAAEEGLTLKDAMHQLDIAYPYVGQAQHKALAKAAMIKEYAVEKVKGENGLERAKVQGGLKLQGTQAVVEGKHQDVNTQVTGAGERNARSNDTKGAIADKREAGVDKRFGQGEAGRTDRSMIAANPNVIKSPEKMAAARNAVAPSGGQQPSPAPQQRQQQQPPTEGDGPAPTAVPPPGMKYQQNSAGTKWRLVPAQ